jgi:hypothetical protein
VNPAEEAAALAATRHWLERIVIGLGLCPFAAAPYRAGRIAYRVCEGETPETIYRAFLGTLEELLAADPQAVETVLLIVPRGLAAFADYLDLLGLLEQALAEAGLEGVVQIASFHPDYRFAGAPPDDPANHSNRSPLPMFHLIREDGLAAALAAYPDPERIPQRNVERLRALGVAGIRRLLDRP